MPRRRPGALLAIERRILAVALDLRRSGRPAFHGFGIAQALRDASGDRGLTAHGTLYKALGRLEDAGLLRSEWEATPSIEGRPRRRLYELTADGLRVAETALDPAVASSHGVAPAPRGVAEPA